MRAAAEDARDAAEAELRTAPPHLLVRPEAPPPAEDGADPAAELLVWQAAWGAAARQLNALITFVGGRE